MRQTSVPGKYEYLNHPADLKIRAYGATLEEALRHLIQAITSVRDEDLPALKVEQLPIEFTSRRLTSVVFDLCQKYLEQLETNQILFVDLRDTQIQHSKNEYILRTTVQYVKLPADMVHNDIKAPTYHEMNIESDGPIVSITVVLDI